MSNEVTTYICNCKSENPIYMHETRVFGDNRCYYCGHYALEGIPNIPNNRYDIYMKSKWRDGPFKVARRGKYLHRDLKSLKRIENYVKLKKEGYSDTKIAKKWGITKQSVYQFKKRYIDNA